MGNSKRSSRSNESSPSITSSSPRPRSSRGTYSSSSSSVPTFSPLPSSAISAPPSIDVLSPRFYELGAPPPLYGNIADNGAVHPAASISSLASGTILLTAQQRLDFFLRCSPERQMELLLLPLDDRAKATYLDPPGYVIPKTNSRVFSAGSNPVGMRKGSGFEHIFEVGDGVHIVNNFAFWTGFHPDLELAPGGGYKLNLHTGVRNRRHINHPDNASSYTQPPFRRPDGEEIPSTVNGDSDAAKASAPKTLTHRASAESLLGREPAQREKRTKDEISRILPALEEMRRYVKSPHTAAAGVTTAVKIGDQYRLTPAPRAANGFGASVPDTWFQLMDVLADSVLASFFVKTKQRLVFAQAINSRANVDIANGGSKISSPVVEVAYMMDPNAPVHPEDVYYTEAYREVVLETMRASGFKNLSPAAKLAEAARRAQSVIDGVASSGVYGDGGLAPVLATDSAESLFNSVKRLKIPPGASPEDAQRIVQLRKHFQEIDLESSKYFGKPNLDVLCGTLYYARATKMLSGMLLANDLRSLKEAILGDLFINELHLNLDYVDESRQTPLARYERLIMNAADRATVLTLLDEAITKACELKAGETTRTSHKLQDFHSYDAEFLRDNFWLDDAHEETRRRQQVRTWFAHPLEPLPTVEDKFRHVRSKVKSVVDRAMAMRRAVVRDYFGVPGNEDGDIEERTRRLFEFVKGLDMVGVVGADAMIDELKKLFAEADAHPGTYVRKLDELCKERSFFNSLISNKDMLELDPELKFNLVADEVRRIVTHCGSGNKSIKIPRKDTVANLTERLFDRVMDLDPRRFPDSEQVLIGKLKEEMQNAAVDYGGPGLDVLVLTGEARAHAIKTKSLVDESLIKISTLKTFDEVKAQVERIAIEILSTPPTTKQRAATPSLPAPMKRLLDSARTVTDLAIAARTISPLDSMTHLADSLPSHVRPEVVESASKSFKAGLVVQQKSLVAGRGAISENDFMKAYADVRQLRR